jgi:hypothetical protein
MACRAISGDSVQKLEATDRLHGMLGGNKKIWIGGALDGVRRYADIGCHHRIVNANLSHLKRNGFDIRAVEALRGINNTDERVIFASGYEGLQARADFPCLANLKAAWIRKPKRLVRGGEGRVLTGRVLVGRVLIDRYWLLAVRHLCQQRKSRQNDQDSPGNVHETKV